MNIYNYNDEGIYLGVTIAKESPLEEGVYLIPSKATVIMPPSTAGKEVARFVDNEWEVVKDLRGETYYLPNDPTLHKIENINEDKPQGYLDEVDTSVLIESKKSEADAKRDELLTSDFEYRGAMFQCDDVSVRNMTVRLAGISNGEIITWRASDNSNHQFSDGDLESMLKIIGERGDQIYIASWLVKADIEAHIDPASLDIAERFTYHLEQINA